MVEIRGQRLAVWPVEDLRERGFDVWDIPREDNAGWVYLEAVNAFLDLPENLQGAFEYAHATAWPENVPALREWLDREENQNALALVRKASQMDDCQMPVFGDPDGSVISVLLPGLAHCRMLAKMLVAEGRRLEAEKSYDVALEQYRAAMRMGHHIGRGMTLIESLVGVSCWALGNGATRDLALRQHIPEPELARMGVALAEMRTLRPTVQRGLECERNLGPNVVEEIASNPFGLGKCFGNVEVFGGLPQKVRPRDGWDRLGSRLGHLLVPDRTIKRHMLGYYDAVVEAAKLPASDERVRNLDEEALIRAIPSWDFISKALLPSLSRARALSTRCETESLATELAAALRLYAARHEGKPPRSLSELRGESGDLELIDPFSGREFAYERTADGWTIYSVGADGEDNDGKSGERWDESGTDMVYAFPPKTVEPFVPEKDQD